MHGLQSSPVREQSLTSQQLIRAREPKSGFGILLHMEVLPCDVCCEVLDGSSGSGSSRSSEEDAEADVDGADADEPRRRKRGGASDPREGRYVCMVIGKASVVECAVRGSIAKIEALLA